jgi:hypothetical protein
MPLKSEGSEIRRNLTSPAQMVRLIRLVKIYADVPNSETLLDW